MAKNEKIALPNMLAFERKLEISDALMFSGRWENQTKEQIEVTKLGRDGQEYTVTVKAWQPIPIVERWNRSTQSAHGTSEKDQLEANPVSAGNDDANLPQGADTLKVSWSARIVGNLGKPCACTNPDFERAIISRTKDFIGNNGLKNLAARYAYNIANGRFLWRNGACAEEVIISVRINDSDEPLEFRARDFSLSDFEKNSNDTSLLELAAKIENGLGGDGNSFVLIKVDAYVKLGELQHVFPSQEMNMNEKKKTLFQLDGCAAMHNVKIGNAIRTIDTWYGDQVIGKGKKNGGVVKISVDGLPKHPIAIDPFGSVTHRGVAYRPDSGEASEKEDLYTHMENWVNGVTLSANQQAYVTANLIRGGVFSQNSKKD